MKKIAFIILYIFLINCASNKDNNQIAKILVSRLKEPFFEKQFDSLDIVEKSYVLNKGLIPFVRKYMVERVQITPSHNLDILWTSKKMNLF